jgi:hypothetical protein
MKRSKIVNLIADFLYELNLDADEAKEKADKLLTSIEDSGMDPPQYMDKGCRCMTCYSYGWEPEND